MKHLLSVFLAVIALGHALSAMTSAQTEIILCEGQSATLTCTNNRVISIIYGWYGRIPSGSRCVTLASECFSGTAPDLINQACHNKSQCTLIARDNVYGNPCSFPLEEYLNVSYKCVAVTEAPISTTSPSDVSSVRSTLTFTDSAKSTPEESISDATTQNRIGLVVTTENLDSSNNTTLYIYIAIGIIAGIILVLLVGCFIRLSRKKAGEKTQTEHQAVYQANGSNPPNDAMSTATSPNNVYDSVDDSAMNNHMVINELYVAANQNEYDEVSAEHEEAVYSKPNKKKKQVEDVVYDDCKG